MKIALSNLYVFSVPSFLIIVKDEMHEKRKHKEKHKY